MPSATRWWSVTAGSCAGSGSRAMLRIRRTSKWTTRSCPSRRSELHCGPSLVLVTEAQQTGTARVKRGMAEMLKGGVIMDVVTAEQAKIAEDAGAVAVMALE